MNSHATLYQSETTAKMFVKIQLIIRSNEESIVIQYYYLVRKIRSRGSGSAYRKVCEAFLYLAHFFVHASFTLYLEPNATKLLINLRQYPNFYRVGPGWCQEGPRMRGRSFRLSSCASLLVGRTNGYEIPSCSNVTARCLYLLGTGVGDAHLVHPFLVWVYADTLLFRVCPLQDVTTSWKHCTGW